MQLTPVASTSFSVLSFELLLTTIISTAREVILDANDSNVRKIFFSSLYAGITTETSGAPFDNSLYRCCISAVISSVLFDPACPGGRPASQRALISDGIAMGLIVWGCNFCYTLSFWKSAGMVLS